MIDVNKPLYAKVLDYNREWDDDEGKGYVIRQVAEIHITGVYLDAPKIWLTNGTESHEFELLEQNGEWE